MNGSRLLRGLVRHSLRRFRVLQQALQGRYGPIGPYCSMARGPASPTRRPLSGLAILPPLLAAWKAERERKTLAKSIDQAVLRALAKLPPASTQKPRQSGIDLLIIPLSEPSP